MRAHMRGDVRAYARMCIHVQIYARVGACKSCPCPFPPHAHHVHGPRVHRVCERTQVPVVYGAVSHARTHTHTHAQQKRQYNCETAMRSCSGGAAARHNFKKVIHLIVFIHLLRVRGHLRLEYQRLEYQRLEYHFSCLVGSTLWLCVARSEKLPPLVSLPLPLPVCVYDGGKREGAEIQPGRERGRVRGQVRKRVQRGG